MIKQTRKRILNVLENSEVPRLLIAQAMIRAISIKVHTNRFNRLFFSVLYGLLSFIFSSKAPLLMVLHMVSISSGMFFKSRVFLIKERMYFSMFS